MGHVTRWVGTGLPTKEAEMMITRSQSFSDVHASEVAPRGCRRSSHLRPTGGCLVLVACATALGCAADPRRPGTEMVSLTALTAGTDATLLAVLVKVPDSPVQRRVTLSVHDGLAESMIAVEPGPACIISARAYDEHGLATHAGDIRLDVGTGDIPYTLGQIPTD